MELDSIEYKHIIRSVIVLGLIGVGLRFIYAPVETSPSVYSIGSVYAGVFIGFYSLYLLVQYKDSAREYLCTSVQELR
jgi:hypothetical protein